MTIINRVEIECCICGTKINHMDIGSTNTLGGSPDLDTRPPEMQRSTIQYWVQRCPSCGYCSPNLSESADGAEEIINLTEYQDILKNPDMPEIATSFMALSFEKQLQGKYSDAAWSAIHAAWICDDENHHEASRLCREKAIQMIEKAHANSQVIAKQPGASESITIDLMRRAGMFQQALEFAESTKEKDIEKIIKHIIEYEIGLIKRKDIDSHKISDALDG